MEQNNMCKRCLLKDLTDNEYFNNVYEYIESLDEEIKTESAAYMLRLNVCQECDNLINGMCRLCGCFVEMRAAVALKQCPDTPPRWRQGAPAGLSAATVRYSSGGERR